MTDNLHPAEPSEGARELLALAELTDCFLEKHGCFPLDNPRWKAAMSEAYALVGQPGTPAREAALSSVPASNATLCEDCPPVGYPTDKTRCSPCPRASNAASDAEVERVADAILPLISARPPERDATLNEREDAKHIARAARAAIAALATPSDARVEALEEALKPFAKLAGPINGEAGRPTYIEAIKGNDGTEELYIGSHYGTDRTEIVWESDFVRAADALAKSGRG